MIRMYYDTKLYIEDILISYPSIFLAGPTDRRSNHTQWRLDMLSLLEERKFNGIVFIPEFSNSFKSHQEMEDKMSYKAIIDWEQKYLEECYCIVFWIPRDLKKLPAFTTNVEFGMYVKELNKKMIVGSPENSEKNRYLQYTWEKERNEPWHNNMNDMVNEIMEL